ncbi:uncharacterized protein ARMOST_18697 [Armillaria ostoyae]|uniref:Uncharacterized protein n=1 Tax=Armillaria ostoyae TaxID=47428 RepID=A0A284S2F5_ARMOS|nr:uncharacterized protein ARMOST_18697 [Armillaria ostoyae]
MAMVSSGERQADIRPLTAHTSLPCSHHAPTPSAHNSSHRTQRTLPSITARQEFAIARERSSSPPPVDPGGKLEEEDVDDEDVKPIPKPPGEPGRPKSGDYNFEQALSWLDAIYQQFNHIHREAHRRLETRKSFKNQSIELTQAICDDAVNEHSILQVYENSWPVRDMLKLRLKYTSEKARHQKGKKMQQNLAWIVYDGSPGIDL